jgi:hypothetical protein
MCPSGNIGVINDSDDYLVIEMQPKQHELGLVHFGPYQHKKLISGLAEWTTEQHRKNVEHVICYHIDDVSSETHNKINTRSSQFIDKLTMDLEKNPAQPYRNHPYWIGAIKGFNKVKSLIKDKDISYYFDLSSLDYVSQLKKLYYRVFGHPPSVNRWHPRWLEYQSTKIAIQKFISGHNQDKTLLLYNSYQLPFMQYSNWLKTDLQLEHQHHTQHLTRIKKTFVNKPFERCICFIMLKDLKNIKKLLLTLNPLLTPNGKLLIFICNEQPTMGYDFLEDFLLEINHLFNNKYSITDITTIRNNFSYFAAMLSKIINKKFDYNKKLRIFFYGLVGVPFALISLIRNSCKRASFKDSYCTNILVTLARESKP